MNDGNGFFAPGHLTIEETASRYVSVGDLDKDGDLVVFLVTAEMAFELWRNHHAIPGDANEDGRFDQIDIVAVLQAGKYRTGEPAAWAEGDWNGDGVFDPLDVITSLSIDQYLKG